MAAALADLKAVCSVGLMVAEMAELSADKWAEPTAAPRVVCWVVPMVDL